MIDVVRLNLVGDAEKDFKKFLQNRIRSLREGLQELFEVKYPAWRKIYDAVPLESVREFPFHGASNLVVPVAAIYSDTLLSRIMAAVWKTRPIWVTRAFGSFKGEAEPLREALEEALEYYAVEPSELDLYRVEEEFFQETIRYGTSTIKVPWLHEVEDFVISAGDGTGKYDFAPRTVYDGPKPEKIPFNDFFISPSAKSLESADFKAHRLRLTKEDLIEHKFTKFFEPKLVTEILKSPDRSSPDAVRVQEESDVGAHTSASYGFAEWDVYECWLIKRIGNRRARQVCWFHEKTGTILRHIYSNYPDEPFVASRLLLRSGVYHGMGFCEALGPFQEEISTSHNQRIDGRTVANAKFARVSPDSKLHAGYRIFPGATVPAEKDEIEMMSFGEPSEMSIDDERMALDLAERRSGVSQPMQAQGSGTFTKRGVYTAMGTLALMQEGNNRTDLNVSDVRYAHTKLGRLIARQRAEFAPSADTYERFGDRAQRIVAALRAIKDGTIGMPIVSATASVNREVEKQNDLMLANIMMKHYGAVSQMLTAASQMQVPPTVKEYLGEAVKAANSLMRTVLRHFGMDEPERLVPEPQPQQDQQQQQQAALAAGGPNGSTTGAPGGNSQAAALGGGQGFSGMGQGALPIGAQTPQNIQ